MSLEGDLPFAEQAPDFWAWQGSLPVPDHRHEWLGTIQSEEIGGCNLMLLTKMASDMVNVLDGETQDP